MKKITFLLLVSTWSAQALAAEVRIRCEEAKNAISRAESVALMRYIVNPDKHTARLGCGEKMDRYFCGSMRMDLSQGLSVVQVDRCTSDDVRDDEHYREAYFFRLDQEDELDNLIVLTLYRSCKTRKILTGENGSMSATITHNQSGDVPEAAEVVSCDLDKT